MVGGGGAAVGASTASRRRHAGWSRSAGARSRRRHAAATRAPGGTRRSRCRAATSLVMMSSARPLRCSPWCVPAAVSGDLREGVAHRIGRRARRRRSGPCSTEPSGHGASLSGRCAGSVGFLAARYSAVTHATVREPRVADDDLGEAVAALAGHPDPAHGLELAEHAGVLGRRRAEVEVDGGPASAGDLVGVDQARDSEPVGVAGDRGRDPVDQTPRAEVGRGVAADVERGRCRRGCRWTATPMPTTAEVTSGAAR